jgi:hypothetical protein
MKSVIKRAASIDAVDKQTAVRLSGRLARDLGALGRLFWVQVARAFA